MSLLKDLLKPNTTVTLKRTSWKTSSFMTFVVDKKGKYTFGPTMLSENFAYYDKYVADDWEVIDVA